MAVLKGTLTDNLGAPISGAEVHVYLKDTTTPATLYSDFEMTVGVSNPLTSEADGAYLCYVADGHYDLHFEKTDVAFDDSDSVDEMAFDGPAFKTLLADDDSNSIATNNPVTLDLGSVKNGDRILVFGQISDTYSAAPSAAVGYIEKNTGTATIQFFGAVNSLSFAMSLTGTIARGSGACLVQVTGDGTLTLDVQPTYGGGTFSAYARYITAVFLKKQ